MTAVAAAVTVATAGLACGQASARGRLQPTAVPRATGGRSAAHRPQLARPPRRRLRVAAAVPPNERFGNRGGGDGSTLFSSNYAEENEDGRFFAVICSSFHRLGAGCVVGLQATPANVGLLPKQREMVLFLNALAAEAVWEAMDRGGLAQALEAQVERLDEWDLKRIYVTRLDDPTTGSVWALQHEKTAAHRRVETSFPQAFGLALRYSQPLLLARDALVSANADFLSRLLLEATLPSDRLAAVAAQLRAGPAGRKRLSDELAAAVAAEHYDVAAALKARLAAAELDWDESLPEVLGELKDLYLSSDRLFFGA